MTKKHMAQLDGLRCFAATSIILAHSLNDLFIGNVSVLDELGLNSVYLFFVLGSWLITLQLLSNANARTRAMDALATPLLLFYAKRCLRLLPALYMALAFGAILGMPMILYELPWHATYLTNVLFFLRPDVAENSVAGHLWSLSVVAQFCIVWPFVIFLLNSRQIAIVTTLVLAAGVYAWSPGNVVPRAWVALGNIENWDSLAFGALAALATYKRYDLTKFNFLAIPLGIVVVCGYAVQAWGDSTAAKYAVPVVHEAMNMIFVLIIINASKGFKGLIGRILDNPHIQYVGVISYGMYIYHLFVIWIIFKIYEKMGLEADFGLQLFIPVYVATIIASYFSWNFVELPINSLRSQLKYAPRRAPDDEVVT